MTEKSKRPEPDSFVSFEKHAGLPPGTLAQWAKETGVDITSDEANQRMKQTLARAFRMFERKCAIKEKRGKL